MKHVSLRAFDLYRQHHPADVDAIMAQRAILAAQRRHSAERQNKVVVGKLAERFRRRHRAEVATLTYDEITNRADFPRHLCRALKISVADLLQTMHGELWMARLGGMRECELADMIRGCLPAAIDEWEQEQRGTGQRVAEASAADIEDAIRTAIAGLRSGL